MDGSVARSIYRADRRFRIGRASPRSRRKRRSRRDPHAAHLRIPATRIGIATPDFSDISFRARAASLISPTNVAEPLAIRAEDGRAQPGMTSVARSPMNEQIRAIQTSMSKQAGDGFDEKDVEALNVIIRICLEVSDDLVHQRASATPTHSLRYTLETVISGLDFYIVLAISYSCLVDARSSELDWSTIGFLDLEETILSTRARFVSEDDFLKKCRCLLDLYKLQLALVAISYG
jgi:hypothetical protein